MSKTIAELEAALVKAEAAAKKAYAARCLAHTIWMKTDVAVVFAHAALKKAKKDAK